MKSEEFGFNRSDFPLVFREHRLFLLKNTASYTLDGRLKFHLILYCSLCKKEKVIRGKLKHKQSEERKMAPLKLAALGAYIEYCPDNRNSNYYPP